MKNYATYKTEGILAASANIDQMSPLEIAKVINDEDKTVAFAVEKALPEIGAGIALAAKHLGRGGRIIYCGAGTSGRLGILDASECPPTFGVAPETVMGIIAGGKKAAFVSVEDAEDDENSIVVQLMAENFTQKDLCVGISASGSAKCVAAALQYAKKQGGGTVAVTNNHNSPLIPLADVAIVAAVGPEVIAGSTRMKAGTAQKMILNMLSTGAMVKVGRTFKNRMAYMVPSNEKLVARAVRMIADETGVEEDVAAAALKECGFSPAKAIEFIRHNPA